MNDNFNEVSTLGLRILEFSDSEINEILNNSEETIFKRGTYITEFDIVDKIFIVGEGVGLNIIKFCDGVESCTGLIIPGLVILNNVGKNCAVKIKVLETIKTHSLTIKDVQNLTFKDKFNCNVFNRFLSELRGTRDLALLRTGVSRREHILLFLALIFISIAKTGRRKLKLNISDACLLTGVSRQYYTSIINELEEENIVSRKGGYIEIISLSKLYSLFNSNLINHFKAYFEIDFHE